jgi:glycine/D-amino acid oxidase-like deaminating enzyme
VRVRSRLHTDRCDIAIIGAGDSGAVTAAVLARAGYDVVVIDRRLPGRGSTLASTALVLFEIDTPLHTLADRIGAERAERAYRRSFKAISSLAELVRSEGISCEWRDRDSLLLAAEKMGQRALATEARYRAKVGLPSQFLSGVEVRSRFGFDRTGAILSTGAAELNPVALAAGCLRAAQRRGARIYALHEVRSIEATSKQVRLVTAEGSSVTARRAVFTTGYEVPAQIPAQDYVMASTWVIATPPLDPKRLWPTRCLVWEAADPYLYVRTTGGLRIMAGGEDEPFDDAQRRDRLIGKKSKILLDKLRRLLGDDGLEVDRAWAGTFADSPSGLPFIGQLQGLRNCLGYLGCGGNGITFAMVAAEIVRAWAAGKQDRDAPLFASTR